MIFLTSIDSGFAEQFAALLQQGRDTTARVDHVVADILAAVRRDGDKALCAYTEKFDRLALTPATLRVTEAEIDRP
jgi:histidinol dehydrogenase